jgi:heme exporter protein C
MLKLTRNFARAYWLVTLALLAFAIVLLGTYTPVEATMGSIQKIFYMHLPTAICTFLSCMVCFIAGITYLAQRQPVLDDLAAAAAKVAVILCSFVLLTGMIWGHSAWGQWWTWSPRLTFSLVLWFLYVVYIMIRASIESPQRRALICAVYGTIAFLDVPLVWLSVRLIPDIHPTSITLAWPMKVTLMVWFVPVILITAGGIIANFKRNTQFRNARTLAATEKTDAPAPMRWVGGVL